MRGADGGPEDGGLGDRHVEYPLLAELLLQRTRHAEDAAGMADVLPVDEHLGARGQLTAQRLVDRLAVGQLELLRRLAGISGGGRRHVDVGGGARGIGSVGGSGRPCRGVDDLRDLVLQRHELTVRKPCVREAPPAGLPGIGGLGRLTIARRPVVLGVCVVVRREPVTARLDKRGARTGPGPRCGLGQGVSDGGRIVPVDAVPSMPRPAARAERSAT